MASHSRQAKSAPVAAGREAQLRLPEPEPVRAGPDWLKQPELQELLRRFKLQDVAVVFVGPRRSYAGKAWPANGAIRMVSVGVHPVRWLLTFLHELAHILDFRRRVATLETQLGRPLRRGSRDGRAVWRMDRPHGQLWTKEFVRLVGAAVKVGLFPGNERAVLAYAASGDTDMDELELDFAADTRVAAEELRRAEEDRRRRVAQLKKQAARLPSRFNIGQAVHFDGGPRQGLVQGKLLRVNRKTCTVQGPSGVTWRVPHAYLRVGPLPPGTAPTPPRVRPRDRFMPGQTVSFRPRDGARPLQGRVVRVNQKTCTVATAEGDWRVSFSLLRVRDRLV